MCSSLLGARKKFGFDSTEQPDFINQSGCQYCHILQFKIGPRVVALHSLEFKVDALELKQSNIGIWFEN